MMPATSTHTFPREPASGALPVAGICPGAGERIRENDMPSDNFNYRLSQPNPCCKRKMHLSVCRTAITIHRHTCRKCGQRWQIKVTPSEAKKIKGGNRIKVFAAEWMYI